MKKRWRAEDFGSYSMPGNCGERRGQYPGSQTIQKYRREKMSFTTIFDYRRAGRISWFWSCRACMGRFGAVLVVCDKMVTVFVCCSLGIRSAESRSFLFVDRLTWGKFEFVLKSMINQGICFIVPSVRLVSRKEALVVVDFYESAVFVNHVLGRNGIGGQMKVFGGVVRNALFMDGDGIC